MTRVNIRTDVLKTIIDNLSIDGYIDLPEYVAWIFLGSSFLKNLQEMEEINKDFQIIPTSSESTFSTQSTLPIDEDLVAYVSSEQIYINKVFEENERKEKIEEKKSNILELDKAALAGYCLTLAFPDILKF